MTDEVTAPRDATEATRRVNEQFARRMSLDGADFERVNRGRLASPARATVPGRFGHAVWDFDSYSFFDDHAPNDPPNTVNPGLWRQGHLNNVAGLFEVTAGVYQVRGLDISNVTFIEGESGWIVIDPLTATETAREAAELVAAQFGSRPVRAVIYTHSHTDHFGGVRGLIDEADVHAGAVQLIAPAGFMEAAVSENVLAGTAMLRRATYMYGALLPRSVRGHVDTGLGKGLPALPSVTLLAPTIDIETTGTEVVIDGVRLIFQVTPGTEAPAEMNIYLPAHRALCTAENCTANFHNLYTPRGAQVRDALMWSKYIEEAIQLYGDDCDVVFASHHWPRFGHDELVAYLESQRDLYRYVHDQTLRLANHGLTMNEIAEELELPAGLGDEFFNRGYYGTLSHNAKAVYQRYLGYFSANPAHLHPLPPVEAGRRYVEFIGGADALMSRARESFDRGEYRWVAEVVNHLVFAEPERSDARELQADALEQLGYQAESGPWRDFYLTGAMELRANGTVLKGLPGNALSADIVRAMSLEMLTDLMGVRLNGPRASEVDLVISIHLTDRDEERFVRVRRGSLSATTTNRAGRVDAELAATHDAMAALAAGNRSLAQLEEAGLVTVSSGREVLEQLLALLDTFSFGFEIVLP